MPVLGGIHPWASQSVCLPPPSSTVFCQASELAGSALFVSERGPAHELPSILMLQICQKGCRLQLIASKCARILWHWLAPFNGTCKGPCFYRFGQGTFKETSSILMVETYNRPGFQRFKEWKYSSSNKSGSERWVPPRQALQWGLLEKGLPSRQPQTYPGRSKSLQGSHPTSR